jgi:hypothetical protein
MKNPLHDSLFCGIVTLQLTSLVFVFGSQWSDSVSLTSLSNTYQHAVVKAGQPFPTFPVYDVKGQRRPLINLSPQGGTIIIKGTCSCDEEVVSSWLDDAHKRKLPITLVVPLDEKEADQVLARREWEVSVVRVRPMELERLKLFQIGGARQLPIMAYLKPNGVVEGVQTS